VSKNLTNSRTGVSNIGLIRSRMHLWVTQNQMLPVVEQISCVKMFGEHFLVSSDRLQIKEDKKSTLRG
jgi:hypothetical protein